MGFPARILVVDDHILFREGLISLINSQPDFAVVGEASNVADAIRLAQELSPEIILMDYGLPDGTGVEAAQAILSTNPQIKIVFLTVHDNDSFLFEAIRSGARGYLLKNMPVSKLMAALRALERDEAAISRQMAARIMQEFARLSKTGGMVSDAALTTLTRRELEVLIALASGASNEEIAGRMFISVSTVKNHIHNILEKLNLKNRRELAHFAERHGLKI
ncbi:MAG: response regulator transcription factor [Anaerolineales bacterium]|nr:response regulator transcription factor [Anaerolineales bacterium]